MNGSRIVWIMMAAGVLGMAGCRSPSAGVTVESYPRNSITVNSKIFGGWFVVTEVAAAKKNDLLQAQITVQNSTKDDAQVEYRFRWLDKNGMEISTPNAIWTQSSVAAKEKTRFRGIAPSRDVEDFDLMVRFIRTSSRW